MYLSVIPRVLEKYSVSAKAILAVQKGYRNESYPIELNDGRMINLLFYKREPSIMERAQRADSVSEYAALAGLPARTRFDTRRLRLTDIRGQEVYAQLYHYLPGRTISWEAYTKKHIKLLGWAMSDLHSRLQSMPLDDLLGEYVLTDELQRLIGRMEHYFGDKQVQTAIRQKLGVIIDMAQFDTLREVIRICSHLPGQQMLHMDMVRGNVLFATASAHDCWRIDDIALSGVIDFEKTSHGHPLFDIARTLAFLLVDCENRSPEKIYKYFLYSGYDKRGSIEFNPADISFGISHGQLLDRLVRLFLLHDFYKFLCHTSYESLKVNHHYIRTRNILLDLAMIRCL